MKANKDPLFELAGLIRHSIGVGKHDDLQVANEIRGWIRKNLPKEDDYLFDDSNESHLVFEEGHQGYETTGEAYVDGENNMLRHIKEKFGI